LGDCIIGYIDIFIYLFINKMKALKPSHRERKRYLLIKGNDASWSKIEKVILEFVGVLGFAEASPSVVKSLKGRVVLAINRGALDKVRAAFLMSGKNLEIVKVSGSLKGLGK
jgi:RNase P/RNase MRP subunit POP5